MAIDYKADHGADLMDMGLIDWFGSSGNGGASGGNAAAGAGGGVGGAIGSAAALLIAIGKQKWDKIFGGIDPNDAVYIPPTDAVIDPPKTETNENVVIDPPETETATGESTVIDSSEEWEMKETLPEKSATETERLTQESPLKKPEKGEEDMQDDTFNNLENVITPFDPLKWAEDQQAKMWEREDAIRAETQAREDNAYQRAVEDMQRAGINPNLLGNITPAGSGGGITNATPADTALAQKQMEKDMELLKQAIDNAFKGEQNQKDRIWSLIEKVLGAGAMLGGAAIR